MGARRHLFRLACVGLAVAAQGALGAARMCAQELLAAPGGDAPPFEVLEQGPVHEAFAAPFADAGPVVGPVLPHEPPAPVEELPPEVRPEGERVEWLPGYWQWAAEREDFVWISGVWRVVPPDRQWVPGYWLNVDGGFQWVAGYWAPRQMHVVQHLPAPPETLELGPASPSPSPGHFWIPGCWMWRVDHYVWRPGYWHLAQADWVWIPSYYAFTPRGYVFVAGYWDYPLETRGWLYAPVWFPRVALVRPHFAYRPCHVVNSRLLLSALLVDRHYGYYRFGAYSAQQRASLSLHFWFDLGGRGHYDPFDAYYRCRHRDRRDAWVADLRADYDRLALAPAHPVGRGGPQAALGGRGPGDERLRLITAVDAAAIDTAQITRARRVDANEQQRLEQRRDELQQVARRRAVSEGSARQGGGGQPTTSQLARTRRSPDLQNPREIAPYDAQDTVRRSGERRRGGADGLAQESTDGVVRSGRSPIRRSSLPESIAADPRTRMPWSEPGADGSRGVGNADLRTERSVRTDARRAPTVPPADIATGGGSVVRRSLPRNPALGVGANDGGALDANGSALRRSPIRPERRAGFDRSGGDFPLDARQLPPSLGGTRATQRMPGAELPAAAGASEGSPVRRAFPQRGADGGSLRSSQRVPVPDVQSAPQNFRQQPQLPGRVRQFGGNAATQADEQAAVQRGWPDRGPRNSAQAGTGPALRSDVRTPAVDAVNGPQRGAPLRRGGFSRD
jgi:hypothetical protein